MGAALHLGLASTKAARATSLLPLAMAVLDLLHEGPEPAEARTWVTAVTPHCLPNALLWPTYDGANDVLESYAGGRRRL